MTADAVLVIGSGAGGAACAHRLATKGTKVIVVEGGPHFSPADYPMLTPRFETVDPFKPMAPRDTISPGPRQARDPRMLALFPSNTQPSRSPQQLQRVKGVGGTTLHYEAQLVRFPPAVFKDPNAPWPIQYADLEPHYEALEELLLVAGDATHSVAPRRTPFPRPAHPMSKASLAVAAGAKKMGMRLVPQALGILEKPEGGRAACIHCGGCIKGCVTTAKASMDVTLLRAAVATGNCEVRAGLRAVEIELAADGAFAAVVCADQTGARQRLAAKRCVLAAGAIETPRLLLLSKNARAPDGIGNGEGHVGTNYMETNIHAVTGLLPAEVKAYEGITVDNVLMDLQLSDERRGFLGGISANASAGAANLLGPFKHAMRFGRGLWGQQLVDRVRNTLGGGTAFIVSGAPMASPANRVGLDATLKDDLGLPVPRLSHALTENDIKMLLTMRAVAHEMLEASGAADVDDLVSSGLTPLGAEPRGTCRMTTKSAHGVVSAHGHVFGAAGLFVADASVFPAAGLAANPALTIMAWGRRVAEAIVEGA